MAVRCSSFPCFRETIITSCSRSSKTRFFCSHIWKVLPKLFFLLLCNYLFLRRIQEVSFRQSLFASLSLICIFVNPPLYSLRRDPAKASPLVSVSLYADLISEKELCMLRADFLPGLKKKVCGCFKLRSNLMIFVLN